MKKQNNEANQPERFETDAEKIVHRHLANKDDVITEDDISGIRIGAAPPQNDSDHTSSETNEAID